MRMFQGPGTDSESLGAAPDKIQKICDRVLRRIEPTQKERVRTIRLANKLVSLLEGELRRQGIQAQVRIEGSVAKDTWLAGENDVDIFALLPKGAPREMFFKVIESAKKIGGRWQVEYAEHPYLRTEIGKYIVEVVPCYKVDSAGEMLSAVDRTPFHTKYVLEHITEREKREVRLLKRFMMGTNCYGAELKIQGFSGYLCELLVLKYRTFRGVVEAASRWSVGEVIDLEGAYSSPDEARELFEGHPLIVIDPIDRNRNVAAAVSKQNFAIFVRACQDFLASPGEKFFFPNKIKHLTDEEIKSIFRRRGTSIFCITFKPPDVVADVLYPQLRKTERSLVAQLSRAGFEVQRSDVWSNGRSVILLELAVAKLPKVKIHVGPPITSGTGEFIKKHLGSKKSFSGPYIDEDGRLVFEIEREKSEAIDVLEEALSKKESFGKHVAKAISEGFKIYQGGQIVRLCRDEDFREFISEYLSHRLSWYR